VASNLGNRGTLQPVSDPSGSASLDFVERRRCRWGECETIGSVAVGGRVRRPPLGNALRLVRADETAEVGRPFRLCETHADELTQMILRLEYPDGRVVFKGDAGLSC
jgi:hypothetical protein